jgi:hypothetical protein
MQALVVTLAVLSVGLFGAFALAVGGGWRTLPRISESALLTRRGRTNILWRRTLRALSEDR